MLEPSFYYGAMYVNYALSVAIAVITFSLASLVFGLDLTESIFPVLGALLVTLPFTLRISRIVWINFFVKYRKEYDQ
jgi:hypothetical protein